MESSKWMIYGATGYTGTLVAGEAAARGMSPILAGRSRDRLAALGRDLGLPTVAVSLADPGELARALTDVDLVLHCAGPFVHTSRPMVEACIATGTHYLDITGEIAVFESVFGRGDDATAADVVLLPGVGFDVVPTDCLAATLAAALPDATSLELAFTASGGGPSRGTLKTMIEGLPRVGAVRRDGKIVAVPLAFDAKEIDFSCGRRWAMTIPWGDLSTAFESTGIPDIKVYTGRSPGSIRRARRLAPLVTWFPTTALPPLKRLIQWRIDRRTRRGIGPDEATRRSVRTFVWGRVENAAGRRVSGTLETPEGYAFTAVSAVECARRVLSGQVAPGVRTPSQAFGGGFVGELPGVEIGALQRGG